MSTFVSQYCRNRWALLFCLFAFSAFGQQSSPPPVSTLHGNRTVEKWDSLSLEGSNLVAEPPIVGEKDNFPEFTRELVRVQWRLGDPIDLYIIKPKYVPKPAVIMYLYSYPSETDRFRDDSYCERVASGGFAAVGFVSALTGHRYTMRPMKEWFVSELQESLATTVHDVQMILNYLSTRGDLDMSRAGMFGAGSGGTIAILSASVDSRIKAIDLLDPWGDWPDWMVKSTRIPENERPNYLTPEFLKKLEPLDPVKFLPQLKSQKIRIEFVADDEITPKAAREHIEAAAPAQAKTQDFENTRQFFATTSAGRLFRWLKDQLGAAGSSNQSTESANKGDDARANMPAERSPKQQ